MHHHTPFVALILAFVASTAAAQTPIFVQLSDGSAASDVTVVHDAQGVPDVIAVGYDSAGNVFRWQLSTLTQTPLGVITTSDVRVSSDGTKISASRLCADVRFRGVRFDGVTWTEGPGLGGTSGFHESQATSISGDGLVVAGLAWAAGSPGLRAWTWTQPATAVNLGGSASDRPSLARGVNGDGSVVVGWKENANGVRQAARWVGGVLQPQLTLNGRALGEAFGVNASGDVVVGSHVYDEGVSATSAWMWSAGVASVLPNLPGETTLAIANDVTDDGALVVGHSGYSGDTTHDIVWRSGVPQSLHAWLASLGTPGIGAYSQLGYVAAVSGDGAAICGGRFAASMQPNGGWIVIFPSALPTGTTFCAGDGSGSACPCANSGAAGHGCASSLNPAGAELRATGTSSVSADTLTLAGSGMSNSSALYFQGSAEMAGDAFGDGLRCAGGTVVRLATKTNVAGGSSYPGPGDPPVSVRGGVAVSGSARSYQVWYRNAAAFCTPSTFNLSNGLRITWGA